MVAPATKKRDDELGIGWIIFAAFALLSVSAVLILLVVFKKLPERFTAGPGEVEVDVLGVNFLEPYYWSITVVALFAFNIFSSMLQKKLVIWQWRLISNGGSIDDLQTWVIMTMNEMLNTTLGFATLFFSFINLSFLLSSAAGRTVGVMLVAYLNGKKKNR